jgi:transaldolase/glucose-6-phosphate isomerase
MSNPLTEVQRYGQSIWYDFISRDLLLSGELRRLVEQDGVLGVTSNPAIFEKAIAGSNDYDPAIAALTAQGVREPKTLFETVAIQDIQLGCDVMRPVYDATDAADGYVSLEVSPRLAYDTPATIDEARRLWAAVGRPNLMIKVPATPEGLPAIQTLISEGINVNVTLLFAVDAYEAVHNAYITGLEKWSAGGGDASRVASVASFFVSRIDAVVEKQVVAKLAEAESPDQKARLEAVLSKVAIANAVVAYASFKSEVAGDRWQALAAQGARPQRVLWASTGTKNPDLPKTLYVDALIGKDTVNTVPAATFTAFKAEGNAQDALGDGDGAILADAQAVLEALAALDISLSDITDTLLSQGCALFVDAFDQLLAAVEGKRDSLGGASKS